MTSIIGSVITRSGGVNLEAFGERLSKFFGRPRSMFVPVAMPPAFLKHIKSASRRALGPNIDMQERSGIEFSMRMIGARVSDVAAAAASTDVLEVDEEEDPEDEDDVEDEVGDARDEVAPIETMTKGSVKKAFGRSALWMLGHCSSTLRRFAKRVSSWTQRI